MENIARRSLVKGAALGVAGFAAALAAYEPKPALAADEVAFDEECEVLVSARGIRDLPPPMRRPRSAPP